MTKEQWIADYKRIEEAFEKHKSWFNAQCEQNEFFAEVYPNDEYSDFMDTLVYHPVSIAEMLQDNKFNMTDIEFMDAVQSEYDMLVRDDYTAKHLTFKVFEQLVYNS